MARSSRTVRRGIPAAIVCASTALLLLGGGGLPAAAVGDAASSRPAGRGGAATREAAPSGQPPQPLSARERERRLVEVRTGLAKAVADFDKKLARPNPEPSIRDLPNAAFAKLLLGQDPREAEKLLELEFQQQDMDEKSPAFGMLPWQIGHPEIHDDNAIEFGTQALGPMLTAFGDKLSPRFKEAIVPRAKAAFAAMDRRNFKTPAYTNIYLMRAVSMILLGEAVADAKAADTGYAQLDSWIDYTRTAGIHEFDSPTYYCTDLNSLVLGYLYAARSGAREKFRAVLDYFWTDIAANYFVPNESLSGPHSRNYDFLHSWGGLSFYFYAEGYCGPAHVPHPDLEKVAVLLVGDEKSYHPPQHLYALAARPERVVQSRWDAEESRTRYNYVTPDFAIGSAGGADYGAQDKMIGVELASPKKLPVLAVMPDATDSPYGKEKTLDKSGHAKPTHLPMRPVCAQEKGTVLALLDLDVSGAPETRSIATNVLLPAAADAITLDGRRVSTAAEFEQPAPLDSVVGVREGNAGVAIRVFDADGLGGQKAAVVLKADAAGLKEGVARLAVYHYRGEPHAFGNPAGDKGGKGRPDTHVRVGLLMVADHCGTDGDFGALVRRVKEAKVRSVEEGGNWRAEARVGAVTLEAVRDPGQKKIISRSANGGDEKTFALSVNGVDLGAPVWDSLTRGGPHEHSH